MNKLSKKGLLLFVTAVACTAFVSSASAASFEPVGSRSTLTSSTLAFNAPTLAGGSICGASTFEVTVSSAATATVTGATFNSCKGTGSAVGCTTVHPVGAAFPWDVTASGSVITINRVHVIVTFTGSCAPFSSAPVTLTGNLGGGNWTSGTRTLSYTDGTGLTAAGQPAVVTGGFTTDGLLNLT